MPSREVSTSTPTALAAPTATVSRSGSSAPASTEAAAIIGSPQ
ncbi:hypothetical protein ACFQ1I_06910 [Kitasatospora arboriphila]